MSKKTIILFASFLIVILHFVFGYAGHYGFDDMHYAKLSKLFLDGNLDLINDHYTYRWTIIFTTALSYLVFGISDFSSGLGAMLCMFFSLYITYLMVKEKPAITVALALMLVATNSWLLYYSDKLMPDLYVVLAFISAFYILYRIRFVTNGDKSIVHGFVFTFFIFFGFVSKGTFLLYLPLFGIIFITDIIKKKYTKFWLSAVACGILVFALYFLLINSLTGDPLSRFIAIEKNSYLNSCSYFNMPFKYLLERISYGLLQMFVTHDLILFYVFLLPVVFRLKISRLFDFNEKGSFFLNSSIILLVLANFMSISLTTYNPMCIDPRHYLYIVPVASIAASDVFGEYARGAKKQTNWLTLLFAIVVLLVAVITGYKFIVYWKYAPLAALLLFAQIKPFKPFVRNNSLCFLFILILIIYAGKQTFDPYKEHYSKQKNACLQFINSKIDTGNIAVLTNNAQKRFGDYYLGFDSTKNLHFIDYPNDSLIYNDEYSEVYIMSNPHTRGMSNQTPEDLPWYVLFAEQLFEPVFSEDYIAIYKMNKDKINMKTNDILVSLHGFESNKTYWANKPEQWYSGEYFTGKNSAKLNPGAFSPTFSIRMDSINNMLPENSNIILNTSVDCLVNEDTPAVLVASLDKEGKPYYWQASNINHFAKVYDNWENAKLTRMLPDEIKDSTILNVYVWNNGKKVLFIDDFEVNLSYLKN